MKGSVNKGFHPRRISIPDFNFKTSFNFNFHFKNYSQKDYYFLISLVLGPFPNQYSAKNCFIYAKKFKIHQF